MPLHDPLEDVMQRLLTGVNPAGSAGAAGQSPVDRIIAELGGSSPEFFGTPGFNPNAQSPEEFFRQAQAGNFGTPAPTSNVPQSAISAAVPQNQPAPQRGIEKILAAFGKPGQAVSDFIRPATNVLGAVADVARESAQRGGLNTLAPNFAAGVRATDAADLQRQLIEAQIGKLSASAQGAEPLTEIAKLRKDRDNGNISQDIFDAKRRQILDAPLADEFTRTQSLRGEFQKETQDIAKSKKALAAAASLINTSDNPISDLAALITTIQSIDNSTVREGELAAFKQMQGILENLKAQVAQAKGEGFTETLRNDIAETVNALNGPLDELLGRKQEFYRAEAGRYKLNPESVAGSPFSKVEAQITNAGAEDVAATSGGVDTSQLESDIAALEAEIADLERQQNGQ